MPVWLALALAAAIVAVVAWSRPPRALLYAGLAVLVVGLWRTVDPVATLLGPYAGSRYFALIGLVVASGIVIATLRGQRAAYPLAAVMVLGMALDFRVPIAPEPDWAAIERGGPVVVPYGFTVS